MQQFKRIAVVVDFSQKSHHALERAVAVAKQFNTQLTLVTCVYQRSVEFVHLIKELDQSIIEQETQQYYQQQLIDLIKQNQLVEAKIEVLWHKHFYRGLLDYFNQYEFDLIIKTSVKHSALSKLLTPTDWHLLRETKAPILFVHKARWPKFNCVLGAINIDSDSAHQALNQDIIEATISMANLCDGEPHLLNVFPWPLFDLAHLQNMSTGTNHFESIRDTHTQALRDYVKDKPIEPQWLHVAEGLTPEETIPEIIKSVNAGLLVLGTVRRSGMQGLTIGNTAEKILDSIDCEVLALK